MSDRPEDPDLQLPESQLVRGSRQTAIRRTTSDLALSVGEEHGRPVSRLADPPRAGRWFAIGLIVIVGVVTAYVMFRGEHPSQAPAAAAPIAAPAAPIAPTRAPSVQPATEIVEPTAAREPAAVSAPPPTPEVAKPPIRAKAKARKVDPYELGRALRAKAEAEAAARGTVGQ